MTQARRLPVGKVVSCEVWGALRTPSRLKAGGVCVGAENSGGAGTIKSRAKRRVKNRGKAAANNLTRLASAGAASAGAASAGAALVVTTGAVPVRAEIGIVGEVLRATDRVRRKDIFSLEHFFWPSSSDIFIFLPPYWVISVDTYHIHS